ncbi:Ada metal-binding domain-containing protein [Spirosoma foliorum]|uniref:Metal-binding protein n=1 Tax=Spirosoma foliorum TaxID=2710596 RepID=A0A7G5GY71_9BACT|nr:Ada metal-binding domain-containing protein [Spirosoma foliorum]QMW03813.1 metal-binding protein [Spirosoma foliorum]
MIRQTALGATRFAQLRTLVTLINQQAITLGGHRPGKIYGKLTCRTGKRMKPENRVFFQDEREALHLGYRPCAICMPETYKIWRTS